MRRLVIAGASLLVVSLGAAWAAPQWTRAVGLDVWNLATEDARLASALAEQQERDAVGEQARRRFEITDGVAADWCDGRLALPEAIDAVLAVLRTAPDWFGQLRLAYQGRGLSPTATDRDVAVCYLRTKFLSMRADAEHAGDLSRAAAIAARLVQFDDEVAGGAAPGRSRRG